MASFVKSYYTHTRLKHKHFLVNDGQDGNRLQLDNNEQTCSSSGRDPPLCLRTSLNTDHCLIFL